MCIVAQNIPIIHFVFALETHSVVFLRFTRFSDIGEMMSKGGSGGAAKLRTFQSTPSNICRWKKTCFLRM